MDLYIVVDVGVEMIVFVDANESVVDDVVVVVVVDGGAVASWCCCS